MKTKKQIVKWLIDNATNEYGTLDLDYLPLEDYDFKGNVSISNNKFKGNFLAQCNVIEKSCYVNCNSVGEDLYANSNVANGEVHYEKRLDSTKPETKPKALQRIALKDLQLKHVYLKLDQVIGKIPQLEFALPPRLAEPSEEEEKEWEQFKTLLTKEVLETTITF